MNNPLTAVGGILAWPLVVFSSYPTTGHACLLDNLRPLSRMTFAPEFRHGDVAEWLKAAVC